MQNLYEIDVPFGQLDRETQIALLVAIVLDKKKWQCRLSHEHAFSLGVVGNCSVFPHVIYRLFSEPETMDTIPWDDIAPEFICAARDKDGKALAFTEEPKLGDVLQSTVWFHKSRSSECIRIDNAFARYKRGTVAPERSLQYRPGCKPNLTNKTE